MAKFDETWQVIFLRHEDVNMCKSRSWVK